MKFKLVESLEPDQAYVLNRSGKLLKCHLLHPHFIYRRSNSLKFNIEYLINSRMLVTRWYYDNTSSEMVKKNIINLLSYIYNSDYYDIKRVYIDKVFGDLIDKNLKPPTEYDIEQLLILLNNEVNQEFCKVRTSNLYFGGSNNDVYIRISSSGFNWFDIIWNFVYENRDWISSITITNDPQAEGDKLFTYQHNGIIIEHIPVDEFINLPGNPILEKLEYKSLCETFHYQHPAHINAIVDIMYKEDLEKYFKESL